MVKEEDNEVIRKSFSDKTIVKWAFATFLIMLVFHCLSDQRI